MAFRIWQSHLLAADLATKRVSQRDSLKYMLLAAALYVQAIYFALWVGTYGDWGFAFELAMVLVISLLGVNECYQANGGDDGEDFLFRFAALAVPVGFNLAVLSLLLGQAIYWGAPFVLGHGTFRDPQMVYRLVSFIMPLAFTFFYYWCIAHHLATVRARQLAFNTENAVQPFGRADRFRPAASSGGSPQTLDSKLSPTMNTIASLRALYLASALYAAAAAPAVGQPAANDDSIALATVAAFHQALTAGNAEAALRLLAPDAVVMEGGELETRRQYQERHLAADIQFARSVKTVRTGMSAAVSGEVAWVTSTSVTEGSYKGRRIALNGAELMVLSRAPTGWLIRAIHWSSHKRK